MRRALSWLIFLPVGIVLVLLAIANRTAVTLSLDPFSREAPALSFTMPLFVLLLAAVMVGVIIGGTATWLRQGVHRRLERQYRKDAERYRTETEKLKTAAANLPVVQG
jgi:uncharacterized integral membrane protein